jgi:large subunit ribosomal protein L5
MRPDDQLEQPSEELETEASASGTPAKRTAAKAVAPRAAKGKAAATAKAPAKAAKAPAKAAKAPAKAAKAPAKAAKAANAPAKAPSKAAKASTKKSEAPRAAAATEDVAVVEVVEEKKPAAKGVRAKVRPRPLPRLLARFREEIHPAMVREFNYKSPMQVPQVKKVVLNMGLGEALTNARALEKATEHMTIIAGQKVVITKARKSIATFKIREGMSIGCMVTLRGHRMYEFLDRLLSVALPRIRDFRGVSRYSFDGNGNYSLGLKEQIVFPEIDYSIVDRIRGFQVVITTSAKSDQEGMRLLELMGMPFTREQQAN